MLSEPRSCGTPTEALERQLAADEELRSTLLVGAPASCPAVRLRHHSCSLNAVRTTNEHVIDDEFVRDVILVATGLVCGVCGLRLVGTAEVKCAGLPQQLTLTETESIYERVMRDYMDDEYGND